MIQTGIVGGVSGMALCWLLTKIWDIEMKAIAGSRPHVDQQEEAPKQVAGDMEIPCLSVDCH